MLYGLLLLGSCAEQFPQTLEYDTTYDIQLSEAEMVSKINGINWDHVPQTVPVLAAGYDRANHFDDFFGQRLYFRTSGYELLYDTIPVVNPQGDSIEGHPYEIIERRIPLADTQFINPEGYFRLPLHIEDSTRGSCKEIFALLQSQQNKLKLELIRVGNCTEHFQIPGNQDGEAYMEALFKEQILDRLQ